jgi:hypothetical protein
MHGDYLLHYGNGLMSFIRCKGAQIHPGELMKLFCRITLKEFLRNKSLYYKVTDK